MSILPSTIGPSRPLVACTILSTCNQCVQTNGCLWCKSSDSCMTWFTTEKLECEEHRVIAVGGCEGVVLTWWAIMLFSLLAVVLLWLVVGVACLVNVHAQRRQAINRECTSKLLFGSDEEMSAVAPLRASERLEDVGGFNHHASLSQEMKHTNSTTPYWK